MSSKQACVANAASATVLVDLDHHDLRAGGLVASLPDEFASARAGGGMADLAAIAAANRALDPMAASGGADRDSQ